MPKCLATSVSNKNSKHDRTCDFLGVFRTKECSFKEDITDTAIVNFACIVHKNF